MVGMPALRGFLTPLTLLTLPLAAAAQEPSMQDLGGALAAPPAPVVIYTAKEIVTLDLARPSVAAVAGAGDRNLATGSLDQVRTVLGRRPFRLDATCLPSRRKALRPIVRSVARIWTPFTSL